jgi:hypothetical protein
MIATTLPANLFNSSLADIDNIEPDVVWVYGGDEKQALIFARMNDGQLMLRCQPIKRLTQDIGGGLTFEPIAWQPGLPLGIIEDSALSVPSDKPADWLSAWHSDIDWLHVVHRTQHSDGLIGLYETVAHHQVLRDSQPASDDDCLMHRFVQRQRRLVGADLIVFANNHWNFDVRGFNPGGNHGSFFRISTHSTWLMAGGEQTHIPRGLVVDEPYDSLSFMPTMLALTGKLRDDRPLAPELTKKGFGHFPGRVVKEVIQR